MTTGQHSILLVDDDAWVRGVYAEIFKNAGFEVYEAGDGAEGLEMLLKHKPKMLFTGIMMPRLTGWELVERMRKNPEISAIPVIISSHLGREEDRKKALALGTRAFVVKGKVTPKDLVKLTLDILERKILRIVVDDGRLDAQELRSKLAVSGPIVLEVRLTDFGSKEFSARLVEDENVVASPSNSQDLEDALKNIESKFKDS